MKKKRYTFLSFLLLFAFALPVSVAAKTDGYIYSDPVANMYVGRVEGTQLIDNLNFADLPFDDAERDAIVRSGVLNMIKAYETTYKPGASVTKEEAIAFALRAVGMEEEAQAAGVAQMAGLPNNSPLRTIWSIGYLFLARNMGLITAAMYGDALAPDPSTLDGAVSFIRTAPATREEMADWLARALQYIQPNIFATTATQQSIYAFTDWEDIAAERVNSVENLLRSNIMEGRGDTFDPKGNVTRLDTARMLRNMDRIHYGVVGLERKTGTVAGLSEGQAGTTAVGLLSRNIFVRRDDGQVDMFLYSLADSSSPQDGPLDAVVLRNGEVAGLESLQEGDRIEYLVEPSTNTVWYAQVTGGLTKMTVRARLSNIDINTGAITLTDEAGKTYVFLMAAGLYGRMSDGTEYIKYDNNIEPLNSPPLRAWFDVTVTNDIVTALQYFGDDVLIPEVRGIVTENNPDLGYLTIIDTEGFERTYNYNTGSLRVQKRESYDMRETAGSIHSLFPDFIYNPREAEMASIEPGDIVSFRTSEEDPAFVTSISAVTSYTTRYGRIREIRDEGEAAQMLMEFENGVTAWFTIVDGVMVLQGGRPTAVSGIQPGDWARILVNQALIGPGYMMESVKEVMLEGDGHHITAIVKGRLNGINAVQNKLNIENAQRLNEDGWSDYQQINQFSVSNGNIEYFYEGRPVTYSYVSHYLNRADAEVYIALENSYAGETVRMVSFRTGRDELLNPDTILSIDGTGGFTMLSNTGVIGTDAGTIVRRNGRLVDGQHILAPDYAVVALNGGNEAAVVDINPAPATTNVTMERARIYSVDEGHSFKVQSFAQMIGNEWRYTPIQREFTIDNNTLFMNDGGLTTLDEFIDYTEDSVYNRVYTIVVEGGRAARVIDTVMVEEMARGTIVGIEGNAVSMKDVTVYDRETGRWSPFSQDSAGTVNLLSHTIIIDRNQVIGANGLRVGQQIKMFTQNLPEDNANGFEIDGYIVMVEQ